MRKSELKSKEDRVKQLTDLISFIEEKIAKAPHGGLRISKSNGKVQYYLITDKGDPRGKYIRKENMKVASRLAKRDLYERTLKEAKREKRALDSYLRAMKGTPPEEVYDNLIDARKALVTPIILSDKEFARRWQEEEYQGNPYHPEEKIYETKRGDMVRSKSEAMIANMYFDLGIPYKYEYPLKLKNGQTKYPDFTTLEVSKRKVIYHEHMGLLENEEYRKANLLKISEYAKSGINLLNNLFITFETEYEPFNLQTIKKAIVSFFFDEE